MAFATAYASGTCVARGRSLNGEALVNVFVGDGASLRFTPAEARKLSADLLQAASDAEAAAGQVIKGNADIAQTGQVAV